MLRIQDSHWMRYRPSYLDLDGSKAPRTAESADERSTQTNWVVEQTATYTKTFAQKHALTVLGMTSAEKNTGYRLDARMNNFPTDVIYTMTGGADLYVINGRYDIDNTLISYLARVNYVYDNKYMLTASIRRNGSSRFGKKNRWGNFPSASVGWRIGQENFMKGIKPLNDLKLRVSYGVSGNRNIYEYYTHDGRLATNLYPTGDVARTVVSPYTMDNDYFSCEKTSQVNFGFDLSFIKNRIHFEADYYKGKSVGSPLSEIVPSITGFSNQTQNIGQVENKGLEFMLRTSNFVGAFQWSSDFNISFNRNKVLKLGADGRPISISYLSSSSPHITAIDHPIACFHGNVYEGVFMNQMDLDRYPHLENSKIGDGRYKDVNKDGKLDFYDRDFIGNNHPNFTGGLNNHFSYRNISLNVHLTFSQGAQILSYFRRMIGIYHGDRNAMIEQLNRWRSAEEPGDGWHFRATRNPTGWQRDVSSAWIEDASFLRIRNLSLAYDFDSKITEMLHLKGFRLYATVHNLYTFTKYSGYDPETSTETPVLQRGADYGGYPAARSFIIGVNVNF